MLALITDGAQNGGMYMSTDTLAVIGSGLGGLLTLGFAMFAGFAWVIRRIDTVEQKLATGIGSVESKLDTKIDTVEQRLDTKIDSLERKLGARIDRVEQNQAEFRTSVEHEFTEVKVAIARIEGPRPRLILER